MSPPPISRRTTFSAAVAPGVALLVAGQPGPTAPQPATTSAGETKSSLQPPDGKWLRDENGAEYYVDRLPRQAGLGYKKLDDESTRRLGGGNLYLR